jgi:hypothetical protein
MMKELSTVLPGSYSPVRVQERLIGAYAEEPGSILMHRDRVRSGLRQISIPSILRCFSFLPFRILLLALLLDYIVWQKSTISHASRSETEKGYSYDIFIIVFEYYHFREADAL